MSSPPCLTRPGSEGEGTSWAKRAVVATRRTRSVRFDKGEATLPALGFQRRRKSAHGKKLSLTGTAFQVLRARVLSGELRPGAEFSEAGVRRAARDEQNTGA